MSTIKNIELIDDVRNDALLLMKKNPDMSYEEAFDKAKKNLIGDEQINEFEFQPFEVDIDVDLLNSEETTTSNDEQSDDIDLTDEEKDDLEVLQKLEMLDEDFYGNIKNQLSDRINVDEFNDEQLEQLYIASRMGVDITKIANNKFSSIQIKFLAVMLASGKNVDSYLLDYNFDPTEAFTEIIELESEEN